MTDLTARTQPAKPDCYRAPSLTDRITEILSTGITVSASEPERDIRVATELIAAAVASQSEIDDSKAQDSPNPSAEEHYRPRVETVEQLDALPKFTVVLWSPGADE